VTQRLGRPRVHLRQTDSTNERAKELALAGAPHGTLVVADEQTAGRGRQGRAWTAAPREALLMSIVLRELEPTLPLRAAVAICAALPLDSAIKWPNDIWVDARKLAGILVEGRPQEGWAVLGIGLNVRTTDFPPELEGSATSLILAGSELTVEEVLAELLRELGRWLNEPEQRVLAAWRERDALRGRTVQWVGGEGTAAGIDQDGTLLVDTGTGRVKLDAGEVHLLPPER
jgi:BirA family transcriptional regulator, biotin operon repressor / biotin---[acetyl-CoA-carboxylase] ligase